MCARFAAELLRSSRLTPSAVTCSTAGHCRMKTAAPDPASLPITIIGRARTPWRRREDAPHQPNAAPKTEGVLEIAAEYRAALADLGSFERIWVIFLFDRSRGWAPKVKPPRGGPKRGVF